MAPHNTKKGGSSKSSGKGTTPKSKKAKSPGGSKKKLTPFNKFMRSEMARLKEDEPEMSHQDRFKVATANWKTAPENPKREKGD
ncbi:yabby like transcription factor [Moniliophthora roreri MCA 2997]|uniref:Yabby like transcription factor n=2 Tax=Moniliophthora roreri TaxID=221103 RepID=V2XH88_MONRO|nr:yabby like transcription factor [Moniliophthora roreri MCA 2997]